MFTVDKRDNQTLLACVDHQTDFTFVGGNYPMFVIKDFNDVAELFFIGVGKPENGYLYEGVRAFTEKMKKAVEDAEKWLKENEKYKKE